ncbi:pyridoxamine 5'-phosphate oxidase [Spongiactinospora rosea]|uniref:Pyridoxamine 5'-phosphate oxidase n=1 Tax=Spongiactinospora rosea TaxID=2248750 RepID=A0A366M4H2_9ACTN|nr:pyridoxal 5'-phosphate synthase [Spongiactinospora rosea]RBQ21085.1 pyridoxamine 5'-phosphate oxidase [Spongiactinospora rosea]
MNDGGPMGTLLAWRAEAERAGDPQAGLMALCTTGPAGEPDARTVSVKLLPGGRIGFVTDRRSRKAHDIAARPRVAVLFTWMTLRRQVTVRGEAVPMDAALAEPVFLARTRPARLGAWASHQSAPIDGREVLDAALAEAARRWPDGTAVPVPPHWAGYVIEPMEIEFVRAGRPDRLHDRHVHRLTGDVWERQALSP